MSNEYLLSFIIPVWNGENYIKKLLDILLEQNTKQIEVIVINDGSTDKTEEIVQNYVLGENNISLISFKKNKGVSTARNIGLKTSNGKYVCFMDADDIIPEGTLDFYREFLLKKASDVIVFGYGEKNDEFAQMSNVVDNSFYDGKEFNSPTFLNLHFYFNIRCLICSLLFKREFLQEQQIEFPINMKLGEDTFFYRKAFISAKNIYCSKKIVFVRIFRRNSATQGGNIFAGDSIGGFVENVKCAESAAKIYPQITKAVNYATASWYYGKLRSYLRSSRKDDNLNDVLIEYKKLLHRKILFIFPKSILLYFLRFVPIKILLINKLRRYKCAEN